MGKLRQLEEICGERGLPLTVQRRIILEAVLARSDHPTAERILEEIGAAHPEISRATVYRTLERLVEFEVIRKVCHPGSAVRYDPNTERHHHLVCLKCGALVDHYDPGLNRISLPKARAQGFRIVDYSIQFRGVCEHCRKKMESKISKKKKRKGRGRDRTVTSTH